MGVTRRLSENGYFPQSLRQAQILILEILNVFLWLKFSPSLILQEISHSQTTSYAVFHCSIVGFVLDQKGLMANLTLE
jgi:hypothetical protein